MPPKKKAGKKADKSKKTKQPGKAAQAPPVKTAMERLFGDEFLESQLNGRLNELCAHSESCWAFGMKMFDKVGRGTLYWLFQNGGDASTKQHLAPLDYRTETQAKEMEYQPVMKFIAEYDPRVECVALVAIKTGDQRDSLMKVMRIKREIQIQVIDHGYTPYLPFLSFTFPLSSKVEGLAEGCFFCSNPLCEKAESKVSEFKHCQRCNFRKYCGRECQVIHWRTSHKAFCEGEKEFAMKTCAVVLEERRAAGKAPTAATTAASSAAKAKETGPAAGESIREYMERKAKEELEQQIHAMINQTASSRPIDFSTGVDYRSLPLADTEPGEHLPGFGGPDAHEHELLTASLPVTAGAASANGTEAKAAAGIKLSAVLEKAAQKLESDGHKPADSASAAAPAVTTASPASTTAPAPTPAAAGSS